MNNPTDPESAKGTRGAIQPLKYTPVAVATISVSAAILAVWMRWTYWPPHGWLIPNENLSLILAGLFTAAIFASFGAVMPKSKLWRRFLQGLGSVFLLAFVLLPVNHQWADWIYYSVMPKPVYHQSIYGPIPGKPREERLVTIHTKPIIEKRGPSSQPDKEGYGMLVLRPVQAVEIVCDPTFSPWYSALPGDRELTFTVWQTKQITSHTDDGKEEGIYWLSELETIHDGTQMLFDARICPLHKVSMERVEVPVSYGLPSGEFMEAYKDFSGGPGFVEGGCISDGKEHTEMSYRCPECVAAYEQWVAIIRARFKQNSKPKTSS